MNPNIKEALSILLNPTVTFFIGILTVLMYRNNNAFSIARERLTLAYQPLFAEIEPFLYKKVRYDDIVPFLQRYCEIEKQYALLINPTLRNSVNKLSKFSFDKENEFVYDDWFSVCSILSRNYDSLCRQCHIPIRSITYRISNGQFKNRSLLYLAWFLIISPQIIIAIGAVSVFLFPEFKLIPYISLGIAFLLTLIQHQ